jgi:hypothetical protein
MTVVCGATTQAARKRSNLLADQVDGLLGDQGVLPRMSAMRTDISSKLRMMSRRMWLANSVQRKLETAQPTEMR